MLSSKKKTIIIKKNNNSEHIFSNIVPIKIKYESLQKSEVVGEGITGWIGRNLTGHGHTLCTGHSKRLMSLMELINLKLIMPALRFQIH